ncbi:hypothetical protein BDC45DRAFT_503327 [Circinella umbellata]|nr:hypothetical protein BDC45DRAFT_503327 [Circinella umbellata]
MLVNKVFLHFPFFVSFTRVYFTVLCKIVMTYFTTFFMSRKMILKIWFQSLW